MSLELALKENTAAVQALIDVWTKLVAQGNAVTANAAAKTAAGEAYGVTAGGTPVTVVDPKPPAKAATPKVEAPKVEAPQVEAPKVVVPAPTTAADVQAPTTENVAPETAAESLSEEVVDLALLTKETTGAATRNRAGLVALLAEFGAARASAIPADKWAEYIAKVRAL